MKKIYVVMFAAAIFLILYFGLSIRHSKELSCVVKDYKGPESHPLTGIVLGTKYNNAIFANDAKLTLKVVIPKEYGWRVETANIYQWIGDTLVDPWPIQIIDPKETDRNVSWWMVETFEPAVEYTYIIYILTKFSDDMSDDVKEMIKKNPPKVIIMDIKAYTKEVELRDGK
jgi:hypothetical protein